MAHGSGTLSLLTVLVITILSYTNLDSSRELILAGEICQTPIKATNTQKR